MNTVPMVWRKSLQSLIVLSCAFVLSGCLSSGKDTVEKPDTATSRMVDNARETVNWQGTYQGMLPCNGQCEGLATMVVLYPDNRYALRTRRIGQDIKDNIKEGTFTWLPGGSQIKLSSEGSGVVEQLRIDQGTLMLLSPQGKVLTDPQGVPINLDKTGAVPEPPPTI